MRGSGKIKIRISSVFLAIAIAFGSVWLAPSRAAILDGQADASYALKIDLDRGAPGLARWLTAIRTRASILMVTAHPDDEDGGMLAYETRGVGARGTLLTLNRGEGGQNAMSMDMYDALGLVRTQELLQADRYYGVDQYWTRTIDYGFSKTREEALEKWNHDQVLADVVRVVRMTRPLVITSVFVGAPTDGHGNHQVAGQMAQEAFVAAGDPNKFPDQIKAGLRPWSPLKVYARVPFFQVTKEGMYDYATDKNVPVRFHDYVHGTWSTEKPPVNLEIPSGKLDPSAGLTFLQIAREGWGYQKSQNGGGTIPPADPSSSSYHRYESRVPTTENEKNFFDGVDTSLASVATLASGDTAFLKAGLADLSKIAEEAAKQFAPDKPAAIAPVLVSGLKQTRNLQRQVRTSSLAEPGKGDVLFELHVKEQQLEKALELALGLSFQATVAPDKEPTGPFARFIGSGPTFAIAIPGQSFAVALHLYNESTEDVNIESVNVAPSDGKNWTIEAKSSPTPVLAAGNDLRLRFSVKAPPDAALTKPYFYRPDEEQPSYTLTDPRYQSLSLAPYPLAASARIQYRGEALELNQVVESMQHIEGIGMVADPLLIGPAISVSVAPAAGAVPLSAHSFAFACTLHSNVKGPAAGVLRLKLPEGWQAAPKEVPFSMSRDGENQTLSFEVMPNNIKPASYEIKAVAEYNGSAFGEGYRLVGYPGVRPYPFYRPAIYHAVGVDVKSAPGLRVGFVPGTGDDVPRALEELGMDVRILGANDIETGSLSGYDAVVLGVRAYTARPELRSANNRLLDYVKNGGVLIVQYNLGDFDHEYGPYPFTLGANPQKVVDEASEVKMLDPTNPILSWPNKVTPADFQGWVEERGHGFMGKWDPHYQALVETHDPEQDPQKGGLLVARYGKGLYIYDAFALYRQLPTGVPGAYRLMANLVSAGKNPEWK